MQEGREADGWQSALGLAWAAEALGVMALGAVAADRLELGQFLGGLRERADYRLLHQTLRAPGPWPWARAGAAAPRREAGRRQDRPLPLLSFTILTAVTAAAALAAAPIVTSGVNSL
jgi:hypothetical protein